MKKTKQDLPHFEITQEIIKDEKDPMVYNALLQYARQNDETNIASFDGGLFYTDNFELLIYLLEKYFIAVKTCKKEDYSVDMTITGRIFRGEIDLERVPKHLLLQLREHLIHFYPDELEEYLVDLYEGDFEYEPLIVPGLTKLFDYLKRNDLITRSS